MKDERVEIIRRRLRDAEQLGCDTSEAMDACDAVEADAQRIAGFRKQMDRNFLNAPPSTKHGWNAWYRPQEQNDDR